MRMRDGINRVIPPLLLVGAIVFSFCFVCATIDAQQLNELQDSSAGNTIPPLDSAGYSSLLRTTSTGIPSGHRLQLGLVGGYSFSDKNSATRFFIDDHTRIALPQFGVFSTDLEAALLIEKQKLTGTVGAYLNILGIMQGVEYNFREKDVFVRLGVDIVLRRGGYSALADRFRLEYVPATKTVFAGVTFKPFWQNYRPNRPKNKEARLIQPTPLPRLNAEEALVPGELLLKIEHSMSWIDLYLTPRIVYGAIDSKKERKKFDQAVGQLKNHLQLAGHSVLQEDSTYHACLIEAFTLSAGGNESLGRELTELAKSCLFRNVIVPFNRLFGQHKKPNDLAGLCNRAYVSFRKGVENEFTVMSPKNRISAIDVFIHLIKSINKVFNNAKKRWDDSRLIWLPLNFGLDRTQYDSQDEMDVVIENVLGRKMTSANSISYLFNDRWYYELEQMIRETQYYHVLIIHDFAGETDKSPDNISWKLVTDGYIPAFINAINEIDSGNRDRLPDFTIFIDEFYYRMKRSKPVLKFLENLYDSDDIDFEDSVLQNSIIRKQEELKKAIANSRYLSGKSKKELRNLFKVHINVTNIFEPVFTEDAVMRDHRKIAFRDVFEDDPALGVAIFTGQGVGESYLTASWEDRSLKVRGTELVYLKNAARQLFLSQGFNPAKVPYYLRPREFPENYESLCEELRQQGWNAKIINVMNETGFGDKRATIVKALMYNLMPPNSVFVAPDSIWASDFWAGMFLSAALRGCLVFPIAPGKDQAPSDAIITLEAIRQALTCMVEASKVLHDEIAAAGGMLQIGLYKSENDVQDVKSNLKSFVENTKQNKTLEKLFPVHPQLEEVVMNEIVSWENGNPEIRYLVETESSEAPKLHLKVQFFANRDALASLEHVQWTKVLKNYFELRREQITGSTEVTNGIPSTILKITGSNDRENIDSADVTIESPVLDSIPLPGNPIIYMTVGSHNQDRRSMMLDGEAIVLVSGYESLVGVMDFAMLLGNSKWVYSKEELSQEFGIQRSLIKSILHWIKDLI